MKKYTLAKPQGPEPHRSRESILFFRKDGTPVDLGAIFETDGDLALSMLAADQVIGWQDGPSITPREDGGLDLTGGPLAFGNNATIGAAQYGFMLIDPDDGGLTVSLDGDSAGPRTGLGGDYGGVYGPLGFVEFGNWVDGHPFLDIKNHDLIGGRFSPRPSGGLDLTGGPFVAPRVDVKGTVGAQFDDTYINAGEGFGTERYNDAGLTSWQGGAYLGSDGLLNIFKPPASGSQVIAARANSDAYPRVRLDWDALLFGTGAASPDIALRRVDDGGGFFWMKSDSFAVSASDPVATGYAEPTAWMAGEGHFSATPETLSDAVFQGGPPTDSWWHLKILASGEFQWDVTGGGPDARLVPKTTGGLDLIGGPLDIAGVGVGLIAHSPDGTPYRLAPPNGGGAATWVEV